MLQNIEECMFATDYRKLDNTTLLRLDDLRGLLLHSKHLKYELPKQKKSQKFRVNYSNV